MKSKTRTIRNAHIVLEEGDVWGSLVIEGGRICCVREGIHSEEQAGGESFDAEGALLIPAMIDAHVHFNEPGRTHWEGFVHGSRAALAGGVSVIFDMPLNSLPPTTHGDALAQKKAAAQVRCRTHYGLWGGIADNGLDQWRELWCAGVVGFKLFMADSGVPEFPAVGEETLKAALRFSAATGALIAVHAEDGAAMQSRRLTLETVWTRQDYLRVHDHSSETAAVERLIYWTERLGARVHIVHASLADTVQKTFRAKQRGVDISVETCPHYLTLTDQEFLERGALYQCAPPLRSAKNLQELWECVAQGRVDWIASDHSPSPPSMKEGGDVSKIWGGISGVQSSVEVVLSEGWLKRHIPLTHLVPLLSRNVAKRFKLNDRGSIKPGYWADLTVVGRDPSHRLEPPLVYDVHRHNPYCGRVLPARVRATWLDGQLAYADEHWFDGESEWITGQGWRRESTEFVSP